MMVKKIFVLVISIDFIVLIYSPLGVSGRVMMYDINQNLR